jgi:hypothetical protein
MSDYQRSTREITFAQLRPEIHAAIRAHAEQHELGDVEREALICCETVNEKTKKPGLLSKLAGGDPDKVHYVDVIVTARHLIWARSGAKYGASVMSARLRDLEVQDYEKTPTYRLAPDSGLEVRGIFTGQIERAQAFIGLGPEPAAQSFKDQLKQAIGRYNVTP